MKKYSLILHILLLGAVTDVYSMDICDYLDYSYAQDPLLLAIKNGNTQIARRHIALSDNQNKELERAFKLAGEYAQIKVAQALITSYPDAVTQNNLDRLLFNACRHYNWVQTPIGPEAENPLKLVKLAIEKGANVNSNIFLSTPLDNAVTKGQNTIIRYLIEQGAQRTIHAIGGALLYDNSHIIKTMLTSIIPSERKKIMTAAASLIFGHLDDCPTFSKDIRHSIILILCDQFAQEHMAQVETLFDFDALETLFPGSTYLKQHFTKLKASSSWHKLTKKTADSFRRTLAPSKKEERKGAEPNKKVTKK